MTLLGVIKMRHKDFIEEPYNPYILTSPAPKNLSTPEVILQLKKREGTTKDIEDIESNSREIKELKVSVKREDKHVLHIKITDANEDRWEMPDWNKEHYNAYTPVPLSDLPLSFSNKEGGFQFTLGLGGVTIGKEFLKYFDKYLEVDVEVESKRIFGLGEHLTHFELPEGQFTIMNKDQPTPLADGLGGGKNLYSHHPFYLIHLLNKKFMAIFFRNSNPQDFLIKHLNYTGARVKHRTLGGIIEFYIFLPQKQAEGVLMSYHSLIGRPYLPAFWGLGSQQCRWGYRSIWDLKRIMRMFDYSQVPLDVIEPDIDYMIDYEIFTVDPIRYPGLAEWAEELKEKYVYLVPNHDPGLAVRRGYKFYDLGIKHDAFIKSARTGLPLVGKVWPGQAVFLDFHHPKTAGIWNEGFQDLHKLMNFQGIMLDMQDISSFCDAECPLETNATDIISFLAGYLFGNSKQDWDELNRLAKKLDPDHYIKNHNPSEFEDLPYTPGTKPLEERVLTMSGFHYSENEYEDKHHKEYNLHSIYVYYENKATYEYLKNNLKTRPFVITRSSFPGSGRYSSKWLGDDWSTWTHMRLSIAGVFNFQLFGTPTVGADICGFAGNGDWELCARWYQLGAFFPFSRNQNLLMMLGQEPWEYDNRNVVLAARNSYQLKYSILKYYYTNLLRTHQEGGPFIRPLFFQFPEDEIAYQEKENTVLYGRHLLLCPALYPNTTTIRVYLPNDNWFHLLTGEQLAHISRGNGGGNWVSLPAPFTYTNLLLRGGVVFPFQPAVANKLLRVRQLEGLKMQLIIAPDSAQMALGEMIADDGISVNIFEENLFRVHGFSYANQLLKFTLLTPNPTYKQYFEFEKIEKIKILGQEHGIKKAWMEDLGGRKYDLHWSYDGLTHVIELNNDLLGKELYMHQINYIQWE